MKYILSLFFILLLFVNITAQENPESNPLEDTSKQSIAPPTSVTAEDFKYDNAEKILINWELSTDDHLGDQNKVTGYKVYRSSDGGEVKLIAELLPGVDTYLDEGLNDNIQYSYFVSSFSENLEAKSNTTEPITPHREWLNLDLKFLFLIGFIIACSVIYFIRHASKGKKLFVRKIAGLEAVDEAIGRATEMGRSILFIPGIHDMDDVQTLAAITILGNVAKQIADYDTKIRMPVSRSLVMTAARETIKAAYQTAGRPDAYSDDMVNYITDEQFGYVAAVDGIMVREKPATIFLLGAFFAESLILAETGNSIGAIQIAGTARPAQLPFFIAACDFTLIGEELFAASAYLSGEPKMLGSLKGQDIGKGIAMAAIVIGVLSATFGEIFEVQFLLDIKQYLLQFFTVR